MQSLPYRELTDKIRSDSPVKRIPMHGMIEVTRRCPLTCAHCYNNLPLQDNEFAQHELSCDEHCRIIDEITAAGCLWLTYSGGEIFARKDFLDIYSHARRSGLIVSLFTNGFFLTPGIADYLVSRPPYSIEITVYGVTRETHERVTRIPGSFEKCMQAINLLRERKLPLSLKTMALTLNEHEVLPLQEFALHELGLKFRYDTMINPRIDFSKLPLELRLAPRRAVALEMQDPRKKREYLKFTEACISRHRINDEIYSCNAGISDFGIDPYGNLSICLWSTRNKFDLRRGHFSEGWDGLLLQDRSRRKTKQTKCVDCSIHEMCGMCPVSSELELGDPEEPVDFYCEVAHLRAKALGITVKSHGECSFCAS